MALALFAMTLTRLASADPPPAEPLDAPAAATPLQVRQPKPLQLDPAPASSGLRWKLLAIAAAAGCGVWLWKKRVVRPAGPNVPELRIVGRTSAGFRSELLLVELGDQRLLLGVTPNSIQNLYIVPESPSGDLTDEAIDAAAAPERPARTAPVDPEANIE
jgi:flagellar biogenesis protein FliO